MTFFRLCFPNVQTPHLGPFAAIGRAGSRWKKTRKSRPMGRELDRWRSDAGVLEIRTPERQLRSKRLTRLPEIQQQESRPPEEGDPQCQSRLRGQDQPEQDAK